MYIIEGMRGKTIVVNIPKMFGIGIFKFQKPERLEVESMRIMQMNILVVLSLLSDKFK